MLKNIKKLVFLALVACFALVLFACGEAQEITKDKCNELFPCEQCEECKDPTKEECNELYPSEECKDPSKEECEELYPSEECPQCPTCPTCPEINEDTCKDFCEEGMIAPTYFEWFGNQIKVGETYAIEVEAVEPEGAVLALTYTVANPEIAEIIVDEEGAVYVKGLRPGATDVTVASIFDAEVSVTEEITVVDAELDQINVVAREVAALKAQLPAWASESFAFPQAWNQHVSVVYTLDGVAVEGYERPADLAADTKLTYNVEITYGDAVDSFTYTLYAVVDAQVNDYARVQAAINAAEQVLKGYTLKAEKVTEDIILPEVVFGVSLAWTSTNGAVLSSDGTYTRPADDKKITLGITPSYGIRAESVNFEVIAAGYNQEEKFDYIVTEGSLATIAGATTATNLVFPARDAKFGVSLTYKSGNPAIIDDSGKIVAHPAEATEVEFTATANYDRVGQSGIAGFNFVDQTFTFKVTVAPATAAAEAANAFAAQYNLGEQVYFPYGQKGRESVNALPLPTTYTHNDVEYAVSYEADENFEIVDGVPTLVTQYLRFTESRVKATLTAGEDSADLEILLNIGVSNDSNAAYLGWRNSEQQDGTLTPSAGLYDVLMAVSYFDKAVGNPKSSYNSPNGASTWAGFKLAVTDANGQSWEDYVLQAMTIYIKKDADGNIYYDNTEYAGSYGGQTNWGKFFVNLTGEDVKVAVGTYASGNDKDGNAIAAYGDRNNNTYDGYAIGFVADKDGKVILGSEQAKLQNYMQCSSVTVTTDESGNEVVAGAWPALGYFSKSSAVGSGDVYKGEVDTTVEGFKVPAIAEDGTYVSVYVTIPAGGYGMSWKYQFYGVGDPSTRYAFTTAGNQIEITEFDLNPYNCIDATLAQEKINNMLSGITTINEANIADARKYYDRLTTADQFAFAGDIDEVEGELAALLEAEVVALQAQGETDPVDVMMPLVKALYDRVAALNEEISEHFTKADDLQKLYERFCLAGYKITLDYAGGVAEGKTPEETAATYTEIYYFETTPETVLPTATKADYIFLGWYDADGNKVEKVLGETKADVAYTAKWIHEEEQYINEALAVLSAADGVQYKPVYVPSLNQASAAFSGTFDMHLSLVGLGDKVIIVGEKVFLLGKSSFVALDAAQIGTADLSVLGEVVPECPTRKVLRPFEDLNSYATNSDSIGLKLDEEGVAKKADTYGYGVLYANTGAEDLTINTKGMMGRTLGGVNYGMQKIYLQWDAEKAVYVASVIEAGAVITLKPGDYVWAPSTDCRFGYGLGWGGSVDYGTVDAEGTAITGVLYNGCEVKIANYADLVPSYEVTYNTNGGWFGWETVEALKAELLADYNAFAGTAYTLEDFPTGSWSPINFHTFLYENYAKYGFLVDFLAASSKAANAKGAFELITSGPAAVEAYHDGQYYVSYEFRAFLLNKVIRPGTDFETTDYTNVAAGVLDYMKKESETLKLGTALPRPVKADGIFVGWFLDEALTQAAPAAVNGDLVLYAKWGSAADLVEAFAEEMVNLFNTKGKEGEGAVTTTKEGFQGSTHPNVKYVFDDAETLAQYAWLFEYVLADLNANTDYDYEDTRAQVTEMLTRMLAGDTTAISGSYANGRSCFRQFIHEMINANDPITNPGNSGYNQHSSDYTVEENYAKLIAALKAR